MCYWFPKGELKSNLRFTFTVVPKIFHSFFFLASEASYVYSKFFLLLLSSALKKVQIGFVFFCIGVALHNNCNVLASLAFYEKFFCKNNSSEIGFTVNHPSLRLLHMGL